MADEVTIPNTTEWKAAIFRSTVVDPATGERVQKMKHVPIVGWRIYGDDDWHSALPVFLNMMLPQEFDGEETREGWDYGFLTPNCGVVMHGVWYATVDAFVNE